MFTDSNLDTISILYTIVSINVIWRLVTNWSTFWDNTVTAADRQLAEAIAVFLLIPVGVFFHEVGHAIATLQMGGTVDEFQWRIFWGYVIPGGVFTPPQWWWLAFSGNLVSILMGAIALPLSRLTKRLILKLILFTFGRVQLIYALILYPFISIVGRQGDWVFIYDWGTQPYAQITLACHGVLLVALWRWNRYLERLMTPAPQPSSSDSETDTASPQPDQKPPQ